MLDGKIIFDRCDNRLPGHGPRKSTKQVLTELADYLDGSEDLDY